jgi:nucleotide-binding universal stress UspA family protein
MKNATIILVANVETPLDEISRFCAQVRGVDAYLVVLIQTITPTLPINVHGGLPFGGPTEAEIWSREIATMKSSLDSATSAAQTLLVDTGCKGEVRPIVCAEAEISEAVSQSAKFADYVFIASNIRDEKDLYKRLAHGVLFESPIALFLNAQIAERYGHILVAWNDSLCAARAIHSALPLLRKSEKITVACVDPLPISQGQPFEPGAALSTWLSHHKCNVEIAQIPSGGKDISACILDRARDLGADLIVAGAYSHSRMRQAIFGGTTRTLLEQDSQPVFLAH